MTGDIRGNTAIQIRPDVAICDTPAKAIAAGYSADDDLKNLHARITVAPRSSPFNPA